MEKAHHCMYHKQTKYFSQGQWNMPSSVATVVWLVKMQFGFNQMQPSHLQSVTDSTNHNMHQEGTPRPLLWVLQLQDMTVYVPFKNAMEQSASCEDNCHSAQQEYSSLL
jgi:hypothetical protein